MRSLCLFASYITGDEIPYYVRIYLSELKKHFSEVVFLTSQTRLSEEALHFLKEGNVKLEMEKNEGYDFGLWYKALQKRGISAYDQLVLVNDSCVLFRSLNDFMAWTRKDNSDMMGMTYSEAIAPHLQSFFLIINKKALPEVLDYFQKYKIIQTISEVIKTYEVGLSQHLLKKGYKINAYMSQAGADSEFSPYYTQVKNQIQEGIPIIKKKIVFSSYRKDELLTLARMDFEVDAEVYIRQIESLGIPVILSFKELMNDKKGEMKSITRLRYNITRKLIRLYRRIRYGK